MQQRTLVAVSAGLGQPSSTRMLTDRLAQAAEAELGERGITAEIRTVELRDIAHDVLNTALTG